MRAVVQDRFGPPESLEIREIETPAPAADELLVRVHAASVNPTDWYAVTGTPWLGRVQMGLFRPKESRVGTDFAGVVEVVGKEVTHFRPGDEVFGGRTGAFAEYVCVREERAVASKPANASFEEAGAAPVAALTALQGLRDKGRLRAGQHVLINGASGGVGTYAVQIAKALGAEVTGVCSTRNVDRARSLGADHVVDYTVDDFSHSESRYDVVLDVAGSRSWSAIRRVLRPHATVVIVGAPKGNRLLGPLGHIARVRIGAMRSRQKAVFFVARFNKADMVTLQDMLESGRMKSVVEETYPLSRIADALSHLGGGHAQGKIVVTV
jgi:NADPH:quinone reductase-like Zn-dependent oxidoreductase